MSNVQPSSVSGIQRSFRSAATGSSSSPALFAGLALLGLGAALVGLGVFHGFEHGSCSTTGYSAHYGPVQHCAAGIGWWMLMLMAGLGVAGAGAVVSGTSNTLLGPALFAAFGAPFVALALRSGNTQLLIGRSSSTGKLYAGIFGACFLLGGAVWAAMAGRGSTASPRSGARLGGVLASLVGVGLGFAIAIGVAGAIGPGAPTVLQQTSGASDPSPGLGAQSGAGVAQANRAIAHARVEADKAAKLAACVTAAGTNTARIQACEAKYIP